jgi:hypothetical protein
MTNDRDDFCDFEDLRGSLEISVANGQRLAARGVGSVQFLMNNGRRIKLTGVLYVPALDRKLMSIPALAAKGAGVQFQNNGCMIWFWGETLAYVRKRGNFTSGM